MLWRIVCVSLDLFKEQIVVTDFQRVLEDITSVVLDSINMESNCEVSIGGFDESWR